VSKGRLPRPKEFDVFFRLLRIHTPTPDTPVLLTCIGKGSFFYYFTCRGFLFQQGLFLIFVSSNKSPQSRSDKGFFFTLYLLELPIQPRFFILVIPSSGVVIGQLTDHCQFLRELPPGFTSVEDRFDHHLFFFEGDSSGGWGPASASLRFSVAIRRGEG
jgi:hypothetical protein